MSETTNDTPAQAPIAEPTLRQMIEAKLADVQNAIAHANAQAEAEIVELRAKLVSEEPMLVQMLEHPITEIRALFERVKSHL